MCAGERKTVIKIQAIQLLLSSGLGNNILEIYKCELKVIKRES